MVSRHNEGDGLKRAEAKNQKKLALKPTTVLFTLEHHESIRRIAKERKMTISNVVREAVLDIIWDDEDIKEMMKGKQARDENYVSLEDYYNSRVEGEGEYKVLLAPEVKETLDGLPENEYKELVEVLEELAKNPRPRRAKRLIIPGEK